MILLIDMAIKCLFLTKKRRENGFKTDANRGYINLMEIAKWKLAMLGE